MASIYSTEFFRGTIASSGGSISYTVPSGFVAVIRDIMLWNGGTAGDGCQGCEVYDDAYSVIYGVFAPAACVGNPYTWEGRAVLDAGGTVTAYALDANWHVRCSGYLLTAP